MFNAPPIIELIFARLIFVHVRLYENFIVRIIPELRYTTFVLLLYTQCGIHTHSVLYTYTVCYIHVLYTHTVCYTHTQCDTVCYYSYTVFSCSNNY